MDSGTECTLSKSGGDTKPRGAFGTLEGRDPVQRALGRLERWSCAYLVRLKKAKGKVLRMGRGSPKPRSRLGGEWSESSNAEDLGLGAAQPGEEKAAGTPSSSCQWLEGLPESWRGTFYRGVE